MLQLVIRDSTDKHDNITHLLLKVGNLVKHVRKSTLNMEETDWLGVCPTIVCATRWSSQLRMIESVLRLSQKDPMWQSKLKSKVAHVTLTEARQSTHLGNVLAPLVDLTEKLQKELGILGMILPAITEIKSLPTDDAAPMSIAAFSGTLAINLSTRYRGYCTHKHLILASLLDPRFKAEWKIQDESV